MVLDGCTLCNSACITCLWCVLISICFPKYVQKLQEVDSSEYCSAKLASKRCTSKAKLQCARRRSKDTLLKARRTVSDSSKSRREKRRRCFDRNNLKTASVTKCHEEIETCPFFEDTNRVAPGETISRSCDRSTSLQCSDYEGGECRKKYKLYAKISTQCSNSGEHFLERKSGPYKMSSRKCQTVCRNEDCSRFRYCD